MDMDSTDPIPLAPGQTRRQSNNTNNHTNPNNTMIERDVFNLSSTNHINKGDAFGDLYSTQILSRLDDMSELNKVRDGVCMCVCV